MPKKPQKPPAGSVQLETLLKTSALRRLEQELAGPGKPSSKLKPRAKKRSKS